MISAALKTTDPGQTKALGDRLGRILAPGDVIFLIGELGTGKTVLVKGMAKGLGADEESVTSPTFTLINEYQGRDMPLYHIDLYRVEDPLDLDNIGLDEILGGDGAAAVEWPERFESRLAPPILKIFIKHGDAETERSIRFEGPKEILDRLLAG